MITYGAVHYDIGHLLAVVVFFFVVGTLVESYLGSYHFLNIIIIFTLLIPLFHLLFEVIIVYFYNDILYYCFVGYSPVAFALFVLEVSSAKKRWESKLGRVTLSWWSIPWLVAVICEVVTFDHVAFLAHIAGIVVGMLCIH